MIFYHPRLMATEQQMSLFMVSNPTPFSRCEDHLAAIEINLHELVERAIEQKENPIHLIEGSLGMSYIGGPNVEDIAQFLLQTDHMQHALYELRDSWNFIAEHPVENSLRHAGVSQKEALAHYSEVTLRTFLTALIQHYQHG